MRLSKVAFALSAGLAVGACGDDEGKESELGVVTYTDFPETAAGADRSDDLGIAHAFVLKPGFAGGQAVQYLDLGEVNPTPPSVYIIVKGGTPVAGQWPIIDTLPGNFDYGPWWQVVEVEAPGGYKANDLKSLKGIKDAGLKMTPKLEAVECAVFNPDATVVTADLAATVNVFWGTGEDQPNPYFDPEADVSDTNSPFTDGSVAQDGDITLQPVWHKRLRGFCYSQDWAERVPLADVDGVPTIDDSGLGLRFDTGALPVFERGPDAADYSSLVIAADAAPTTPGQPGSAADIDAAGAAPFGYVDNPILGTLDYDRFEITIENTAEAELPLTAAIPFGAGALLVADATAIDTDDDGEPDTSYIFEEGLPASDSLNALVTGGNTAPLYGEFPGQVDPFFGTIADFQSLPPIAPGDSITVIVVATPFVGVLQTVHATPTLPGEFAGSITALYDADGNAIATATSDISVFQLEDDTGVVAASTTTVDAVGTVTVTHLTAP